jgi:acyl-CoA thioesterase
MSFDSDTELRHAGDGVWEGEIAEGWDTPRGPLGGYVMAIVLRALGLAIDEDERQPRSVTMHFLRVPKTGPVTVRVAVERAGRSLTSLSARLEQEGKLLGLALGAYSKPWPSPYLNGSTMPEVAPPGSPDAPGAQIRSDKPPAFLDRLTLEHRFGADAFSGADRGETGGWLAIRDREPIAAPAIAVLADAWFPAPWPRLTALAPAPTIDLTVHFRSPLPIASDVLLGRFTNRVVREGFFDENGELWAPDGTLVAQSRQLGLLLGAEAPG